MLTLGLTGMSGSGKSYVASIIAQYGIPSVDADKIVHSLYSGENDCTRLIAKRFGENVLNANHSINRKALGAIVFKDRDMLSLLNETVHPYVIAEIENAQLNAIQNGDPAIVIDAPQLYEARLETKCDYVIAVLTDTETQIKRIMTRDTITEEAAKRRLSNQHSQEFFRERADFCIENRDGNDISAQVFKILKTIGLLV